MPPRLSNTASAPRLPGVANREPGDEPGPGPDRASLTWRYLIPLSRARSPLAVEPERQMPGSSEVRRAACAQGVLPCQVQGASLWCHPSSRLLMLSCPVRSVPERPRIPAAARRAPRSSRAKSGGMVPLGELPSGPANRFSVGVAPEAREVIGIQPLPEVAPGHEIVRVLQRP